MIRLCAPLLSGLLLLRAGPSVASARDDANCTASADCGAGDFCGVRRAEEGDRGPVGFPPHPTCYACDDDNGGCAGFVKLDGESCRDACPAQHECDGHRDCAGGEFCTHNHRCRGCRTGACWTPARETLDLDDVGFYRRFYTSIDFGCPEECCDWGLSAPPYWGPYHLVAAVGPCDGAVRVEAFWAEGDESAWTAEDFVERGTACAAQRYEFADGLFPPAVTTLDCAEELEPPPCSTQVSTLALVTWNSSRPDKLVTFAEPGVEDGDNKTENAHDAMQEDHIPHAYPLVHLFDMYTENCAFDDAIAVVGSWLAGIGIALACIIGVGTIVGVLLCVLCCRRCRCCQRQEGPV